LREWQEKFSDFFDQFDGQGLCHLRGLLIAHTLNPEEETIQDAEIFVWHDRFALGEFGGVLAVPVGNSKVFSSAEQGGGGSGVGHAQSITLGPTKRNIFFHVFSFFFLHFFCVFFLTD
jgi:hypothetical protein